MNAEIGNQVYDRTALPGAKPGNGHRLAPAAASSFPKTKAPQAPPTGAACPLTSRASRWRSVLSDQNQTMTKTMKSIQTMTITLFALVGAAGLVALPALAKDKPEHSKKLYGEGLCAKCELKETDKCQTAIRVPEGDRKVVYYAKDNDVAKAFHPKICKSVEPVKAVGNVQEKDGKRHITLTHIEVTGR